MDSFGLRYGLALLLVGAGLPAFAILLRGVAAEQEGSRSSLPFAFFSSIAKGVGMMTSPLATQINGMRWPSDAVM